MSLYPENDPAKAVSRAGEERLVVWLDASSIENPPLLLIVPAAHVPEIRKSAPDQERSFLDDNPSLALTNVSSAKY
ncbi:MAG TPA: hypothetical protein VM715_23250 [Candidatus Acidoferrum sp.]|nr:hypothetical protein [Candidatus Acidoferrum sp.]